VRRGIARSRIEVVMTGGSLRVEVSDSFDVTLTGAVEEVCRGQLAESWVHELGRLRPRRARP
jgi:diaminopimelate epimerase